MPGQSTGFAPTWALSSHDGRAHLPGNTLNSPGRHRGGVQRHWEGHLGLPEVAYGAFLTSKTMQWRVSKRKGPGIGQTHKASRVLGAEGVHYPK